MKRTYDFMRWDGGLNTILSGQRRPEGENHPKAYTKRSFTKLTVKVNPQILKLNLQMWGVL